MGWRSDFIHRFKVCNVIHALILGTGGRDTAGLGGKGGPYRLVCIMVVHVSVVAKMGSILTSFLECLVLLFVRKLCDYFVRMVDICT